MEETAIEVLYFLKERTRLIRVYYAKTSQPFREILRKIEAEEEPFVPPYSEDPEPAFLTEWLETRDLLEVTGRSCISMLAASLTLFLRYWERQLGLICKDTGEQVFRGGLLNGYRYCFETVSGKSWESCPANLALIEQVLLARNRDQHPEDIWGLYVSHSARDREKYPSLFFVEDAEQHLIHEAGDDSPWMSARIHVSAENWSKRYVKWKPWRSGWRTALYAFSIPHVRAMKRTRVTNSGTRSEFGPTQSRSSERSSSISTRLPNPDDL